LYWHDATHSKRRESSAVSEISLEVWPSQGCWHCWHELSNQGNVMADGLLMAYGLRRLNFQQHGSKAARPKASCDLTKNHGLNSGL
jgi:hypothetical protein